MSDPRAFLHVAGAPAPKGSRVYYGNGGSREASARCKPWVEQIAYAARANRPAGKTLAPPYVVELEFFMPRPQRAKYEWPTRDGDLDKLERAVLDGLTQGGLIVDDRHVVELRSRKCFAPGSPGVAISIT